MGGFFIARKNDGSHTVTAAAAARRQFRLSGFGEPLRLEDSGYILDYYPKHGRPTGDLVCFNEGDFIASVGTFIFGGTTGTEALRRFWNEANHAASLADCRGHFALIERRARKTTISRDALGAYEVYHDREFTNLSTSFLALARNLPRRTLSPAECVEYVLNGVTFGTGTPITEIHKLDIADSVALGPAPYVTRHHVTLVGAESPAPFAEQLEHSISVLRNFIATLVEAFCGRIKVSFSGGYDSRLLLALLRAQGVTPALYVYGPDNADDVRIAKEIAAAEKVPLEHVDKEQYPAVSLDAFPEMVRRNFDWNDGFPQMGMLFSNAENELRAERSRGDVLVLNGGGGEVFRDFFKFADRNISARDFGRCFFSHYKPNIFANAALRARFEEGLGRKVETLLGKSGAKLDRREIDCLYPHFRCRSWFGRNNSIDNRFGNSVLPYYDREVVEAALRLPIRWKRFGNFQGRMIRELDAALARHSTSHGFALDRNTPLQGMLPDLLLYGLPTWLRPFNYRIKQHLRREPPRWRTLAPEFLAAILDTRFPFMSDLFALPHVQSDQQLERIATLEYMFESLDAGVGQ